MALRTYPSDEVPDGLSGVNDNLLENTDYHFRMIVENWGGDDPDGLERNLKSLLERIQMDIRNDFSTRMVEREMQIKDL